MFYELAVPVQLRPYMLLCDWKRFSVTCKAIKQITAECAQFVDFKVSVTNEPPAVLLNYILEKFWHLKYAQRQLCIKHCTFFKCNYLQNLYQVHNRHVIKKTRHPYTCSALKSNLAYPHLWMTTYQGMLRNPAPPLDRYISAHGVLEEWYIDQRPIPITSPVIVLSRMDSIEWRSFTSNYIEIPVQYSNCNNDKLVICNEPVLLVNQDPRTILICTATRVEHCSATVEYMRSMCDVVNFLRTLFDDGKGKTSNSTFNPNWGMTDVNVRNVNWQQGAVLVFGSILNDLNPFVIVPETNRNGLRRIYMSPRATSRFVVLMTSLLEQRHKIIRAAAICRELELQARTEYTRNSMDSKTLRYPSYQPHLHALMRHADHISQVLTNSIIIPN